MNYLNNIINLADESLTPDNFSGLIDILKPLHLQMGEHFFSHLISMPYALNNIPAFKPITIKTMILNHPLKAELNNTLNNKNNEHLLYWDAPTQSIQLAKTRQEIKLVFDDFINRGDTQGLNNYVSKIISNIKSLVKELPQNISDIQFFAHPTSNDFLKYDAVPLLRIVEIFPHHSVLDTLIQEYPQVTEYFNMSSPYYSDTKKKSDNTLYQIDPSMFVKFVNRVKGANYNNDSASFYLSCFKKGLLNLELRNFIATGSSDIVWQSLKYAVSKNDMEGVKFFLANPNLLEPIREINKTAGANSLGSGITNFEMLKLLTHYNFPLIFTHDENHENMKFYSMSEAQEQIEKNASFKKEMNFLPYFTTQYNKKINALNSLVTLLPQLATNEFLQDYAEQLFSETSLENYSKIYETFPQLDLSKVDLFNHIARKNINWDTQYFKDALEHGYDPRFCSQFINFCGTKSDGVKMIKSLNKEGIIVARNPDYLFHSFRKGTKSLISVFDKASDEVFNKFTLEGNLAWWGANSPELLKQSASRAIDVTLNGKQGQSVFFYFAKAMNSDSHKFTNFKTVTDLILSKLNKPDDKFDFSYVDEKTGNNFFHEFLTIRGFNSSNFNITPLSILAKHSKSDFFENINAKNNEGYTPIELLLRNFNTIPAGSAYSQIHKKTLDNLIVEFGAHIKLNDRIANGTLLGDALLNIVDSNTQIIIEDKMMRESVALSTNHSKTLKF